MAEPLRYKAFISYSHRDEKFVRWLHRQLEGWSIPRELAGRETRFGPVPARLRPIFRDRDDFSGGSSLKAATMAALADSEALIVVCSPNSAKSPHVDSEIRQFKQLGRSARVVPIIIEGEPGDPERNCFPPALLVDLDPDDPERTIPVEPIAADARDQGDGRQRATAKVVAGLLDLPFDEIVRREERGRRARLAGWAGAGAGAFIFATALSSFALYNAYQTSLTIEKGVFAIGGMIEETNRASLDPETRDQTISTQCDLMDSLAGDKRDLAGLVEQAICFNRRTQAAAEWQGAATTTRILCDWRDGLMQGIKERGKDVKADEVRSAAFAMSQVFQRVANAPETAGECDPKSTDVDAHADFLLDGITGLAKLRPDLDDIRSIHEGWIWEVIERHENREEWAGSEKIMREAAELRRQQAKDKMGNDYVPQALMDRAVYLRRLSWLKYTWQMDPPEAVRLAGEAVSLWDEMRNIKASDVDGMAYEVALAHQVLCEALAADDKTAEALNACETGMALTQGYLASSASMPEEARKSLEEVRNTLTQHLGILKENARP